MRALTVAQRGSLRLRLPSGLITCARVYIINESLHTCIAAVATRVYSRLKRDLFPFFEQQHKQQTKRPASPDLEDSEFTSGWKATDDDANSSSNTATSRPTPQKQHLPSVPPSFSQSKCTQVVLVASSRDVHHHAVYPTPEYFIPRALQSPEIFVLPDPCTIDIDGLRIGITSIDTLMHLGREEVVLILLQVALILKAWEVRRQPKEKEELTTDLHQVDLKILLMHLIGASESVGSCSGLLLPSTRATNPNAFMELEIPAAAYRVLDSSKQQRQRQRQRRRPRRCDVGFRKISRPARIHNTVYGAPTPAVLITARFYYTYTYTAQSRTFIRLYSLNVTCTPRYTNNAFAARQINFEMLFSCVWRLACLRGEIFSFLKFPSSHIKTSRACIKSKVLTSSIRKINPIENIKNSSFISSRRMQKFCSQLLRKCSIRLQKTYTRYNIERERHASLAYTYILPISIISLSCAPRDDTLYTRVCMMSGNPTENMIGNNRTTMPNIKQELESPATPTPNYQMCSPTTTLQAQEVLRNIDCLKNNQKI
ncbi:unnamed protein product [Trichogramma brassicae]|uniref:DNA polymerase alpha subunit B n=1 Tax=Trichogramma brassicae TaxID=86971 RepID=A0A6H5IAS3_9HYME|nr:unnamed protein product [Trichogramma brassicae]